MEGNRMNEKLLYALLILFTFPACTRSLDNTAPQLPLAIATPTLSLPSPVPPPLPSFTPITQPTFSGGTDTYAVILVPSGDVLNIRSRPGVENPVLGVLQPTQSGLIRTGQAINVGADIWVEIENPSSGAGWVDADFLTEYIPPSEFCVDVRISSLLSDLESAVNTRDGEIFKSLVSPAHGLNLGYIRAGMIANYSAEEASWAFQSSYVIDWGPGAGSGEPMSGTFPEIILPALQDVFKNLNTACNEVQLGGATYLVEWPVEYANINYYSLYNPGNDPSFGGLDWRTWLAGVEYVDEQPYLFALMHYQWEP
jgi:hypothetical protein